MTKNTIIKIKYQEIANSLEKGVSQVQMYKRFLYTECALNNIIQIETSVVILCHSNRSLKKRISNKY